MKTFLIIFSVCIFITSCKKKDSLDYEYLTKQIQNKKWGLSYVKKISSNNPQVIDSNIGRQYYEKDDYTIWFPDHKYVVYDNAELNPNANSAIVDSGVYAWNDNVFVMQSTVTTSFVNFDFESVSETEICFSLHFHSPDGQSYIYYKKIE